MGSFGPIALAAQNVVNQLAYIVYQVNIGLSQGSSILVSRAIGQGNRREAGQIAKAAITLSAVAMTLVGLVYLAVPTWVLRLFLERQADPAVVALAKTLLFFAIAQQFLKGAQNVSVGLLRGLGNTKSGFRITLIGYWAVGTPAMLGSPMGSACTAQECGSACAPDSEPPGSCYCDASVRTCARASQRR